MDTTPQGHEGHQGPESQPVSPNVISLADFNQLLSGALAEREIETERANAERLASAAEVRLFGGTRMFDLGGAVLFSARNGSGQK